MRNDAIQKDVLEEGLAMDMHRRAKDVENMGWEGVKGYVRPCLAPSKWEIMGAKRMGQLAHSDFLDLSVYYYIRLESRHKRGTSVAWVNRGALEDWGISMETLNAQAIKNMDRDGYSIQPIDKILNGILGGAVSLENSEGLSMYAFTNRTMILGAAGILGRDKLAAFAGKAGGDLYIIPSSVHETLLCLGFNPTDEKDLNQMVKEVNRTQVELYDRLSDHVYYYDRVADEIREKA